MYILAIETSCDETACALVENGIRELASTVASSADFHQKTGGIVPEVAARKQVEFIVPVINDTLETASKALGLNSVTDIKEKIDAIAVTYGPGLVGSLIVGIESAKALASSWEKPLIPVNHLIGHIYGNFINLDGRDLSSEIFPCIVLVVSGGHTDLIFMRNHGDFDYLGGTIDDAAGEAFDKAARLLGLGNYLGGPILSQRAADYRGMLPDQQLPRPLLTDGTYNFSFSGLKTAVKRMVESEKYETGAVAKEFENAVVETLVKKTLAAAKAMKAKTILLAGGVSANSRLRKVMEEESAKIGIKTHYPPLRLCTDNAVYIAGAAFFNQTVRKTGDFYPKPDLTISG